eukprot:TRINITY_DN2107_c0_g1_i2.p2 TRINITY_DN2107_c0_g1~~TRINITY_DN2107_c0_g1_i2.p2  ORF type:complete len:101 (+),score=22.30 TRINITY_DN2107_c0_g1_i2:525-827(+)
MDSSEYDAPERTWLWLYEGHSLFIDRGEDVRFRVAGVQFREQSVPEGVSVQIPLEVPRHESLPNVEGGGVESSLTQPTKPLMRITASLREDGLGPVSWWT